MSVMRSIARKIPGLHRLYMSCLNFADRQRLKGKAPEEVFTEIYEKNIWGSNESISGPGSAAHQTRMVVEKMPILLRDLGVAAMLDIPCGDFNWLKDADLENINYTGADIVNEIVKKNKDNYQKENVNFQKMNLLADKLPKVDLIFCRDCLVHFSFEDIQKALRNICRSGSSYLLTTTFTEHSENPDIMTGQWRPVNFELEPFNFPKPDVIINEECTEGDGKYADKSLALWRIDEINKIVG